MDGRSLSEDRDMMKHWEQSGILCLFLIIVFLVPICPLIQLGNQITGF